MWPAVFFFSPSSKCLVRLIVTCDFVLQTEHSIRNTIFFVVFACQKDRGQRPGYPSRSRAPQAAYLLVENRLCLTAVPHLLLVISSLPLRVVRRLPCLVLPRAQGEALDELPPAPRFQPTVIL